MAETLYILEVESGLISIVDAFSLTTDGAGEYVNEANTYEFDAGFDSYQLLQISGEPDEWNLQKTPRGVKTSVKGRDFYKRAFETGFRYHFYREYLSPSDAPETEWGDAISYSSGVSPSASAVAAQALAVAGLSLVWEVGFDYKIINDIEPARAFDGTVGDAITSLLSPLQVSEMFKIYIYIVGTTVIIKQYQAADYTNDDYNFVIDLDSDNTYNIALAKTTPSGRGVPKIKEVIIEQDRLEDVTPDADALSYTSTVKGVNVTTASGETGDIYAVDNAGALSSFTGRENNVATYAWDNSTLAGTGITELPSSPTEGSSYSIADSKVTGAWSGQEGKYATWTGVSWTFADTGTSIGTSCSPPVSPNVGDVYLVCNGLDGALAGHEGEIAYWSGAAWSYTNPWEFRSPVNGEILYVPSENKSYIFSCTEWLLITDPSIAIKGAGGNVPPDSPGTGDTYIIGSSPTGLWDGYASKIATWNGTVWVITDPSTCDVYYSEEDDTGWAFEDDEWTETSVPEEPDELDPSDDDSAYTGTDVITTELADDQGRIIETVTRTLTYNSGMLVKEIKSTSITEYIDTYEGTVGSVIKTGTSIVTGVIEEVITAWIYSPEPGSRDSSKALIREYQLLKKESTITTFNYYESAAPGATGGRWVKNTEQTHTVKYQYEETEQDTSAWDTAMGEYNDAYQTWSEGEREGTAPEPPNPTEYPAEVVYGRLLQENTITGTSWYAVGIAGVNSIYKSTEEKIIGTWTYLGGGRIEVETVRWVDGKFKNRKTDTGFGEYGGGAKTYSITASRNT